jgi:hypothetical protein
MRTTVAEAAMTVPAPTAASSSRRVSGDDCLVDGVSFDGVAFTGVGFASECRAPERLAVECFDDRWFMTTFRGSGYFASLGIHL